MTKIIIVRHGEVAGNNSEKRAFVGWRDLPLNPRGELQAEAVGEFLKDEEVSAVYASDLQRARNTALHIAKKHGLEVQSDAALREVNYGDWEGLGESELLAEYSEEWRARQNDPWNVGAVNGENYAQMWARFLPRWNAMVEKHDGETIVLVGHSGLIRVLLCYLIGAPFENLKRILVSNCGVTRLEIAREPDGVERVLLKGVNDISHLKNSL